MRLIKLERPSAKIYLWWLNSIYKAVMDRDTKRESIAHSERSFCSKCSSMLWLYDERWYANIQLAITWGIYADVLWRPELVHPFASAIDSELTDPEEMARIFDLLFLMYIWQLTPILP